MGYIRNVAVIVTGSGPEFDQAYQQACRLFPVVVPPAAHLVGGDATFLIPPSGHRLEWGESEPHEAALAEFRLWLQDDERIVTGPDWAEVQYGGDDLSARVRAHSGDLDPKKGPA